MHQDTKQGLDEAGHISHESGGIVYFPSVESGDVLIDDGYPI